MGIQLLHWEMSTCSCFQPSRLELPEHLPQIKSASALPAVATYPYLILYQYCHPTDVNITHIQVQLNRFSHR